MSVPNQPGALVISLDFELHWGVRDHVGRDDALYRRLPEARRAVADLSALFASRHISATWATVGFLFASTRQDLEAHLPAERPAYGRPNLDPYGEAIGLDEERDPEHLAGSLVDLIAHTEGQEVGSHTFSHYYCLDPGQSEATFRADLAAAQSIAHWRGLETTSLVLPRNQWNPAYTDAVLDLGYRCIRGPQQSWSHQARHSGGDQSTLRRGARLADTYVGAAPPPTTAWDQVLQPSGLCDIPASAFMRPFDPRLKRLEPLRLARLRSGMRRAARRGRIFHLWWHPHNFSQHQRENFSVLEGVLDEFDRLAGAEGMLSLSMGDVTNMVAPHAPVTGHRQSGGPLQNGGNDPVASG
jgi:peptidoglycan/xylan/chitin deacetylase (PgdA/CDA1 family)